MFLSLRNIHLHSGKTASFLLLPLKWLKKKKKVGMCYLCRQREKMQT